ncbi:hypothetical protein [Clostridium perfringens]|uniref:hypothetical protein n=1 Tax=Clostridium perfringens TaxID=1502 RepID=UPI003BAD7D2C
MKSARYKEDGEIFIDVYAENITPKQYEEIYKGRLYCEYSDCNAELIYAERQKGRFIRYFSTRQGSRHKLGCPNEIHHSGSKASIIRVKGNDANISDKHIDKVLSDAYKSFCEKLNPSNFKKKKHVSHKKKVEVSRINDENPVISIISTPTTNGEGEAIIEGKEPYIYKREVSDIKSEDKNSYKEVHALVKDIRLYEDEVYIDLIGLDGSEFSVYIGIPFKNSYSKEFRLLYYLKEYIEKQKLSNKQIICTSIGEIMELGNKPVIQIYSYRHIRLDNLGLYKIINTFQNENFTKYV